MRSAGDSDSPPEPQSPPEFGSGVAYLRDGRAWYQLRVKLEMPNQSFKGGSIDRVELTAVSTLWQYNRKTKNYDLPLRGASRARLVLAFTFDRFVGGELGILPTNGTTGSGASGLPGKNINVEIAFAKSPDPASPEDSRLVVTGIAELVPDDVGERKRLGALALAQAERTWQIQIDEAQRVQLEELP